MTETNNKIEFEETYLETNYIVRNGKFELRFRIGETNLDDLLNHFKATTWAFITAFNPHSQQLTDAENNSRQAELVGIVQSKNLGFLEGFGECTTPDWQHEICLFIFDIELNSAIELGKIFEQNAILYGELGSVPQLIWC